MMGLTLKEARLESYKKVTKAVNEASISVACLLDDVVVNDSSELNLSELRKDIEHLQDKITKIEMYFWMKQR